MRRKKQEEAQAKEKQARKEKEDEENKIRNLRQKKEQLTKTLQEGQRLIYKQCYSKPLYSFNKKLNDLQMKNEDFAWLNEKKQDDEFAKDIIGKLLSKITELEKTVTGHATTGTFTKI